MEEYAQTLGHLEEMGSGLYELIKHRNLTVYPDKDMRLAVSRAVAVETPRGWKITKEKTSHKIDVVVALAMAALGAVESQGRPPAGGPILYTESELKAEDFLRRPARARSNGTEPEPVKVFGGFAFGGNSAMPDSVHREDDDRPPPGLAPSPFV